MDEGAPGPEGDEGVIATYVRNGDGTLSGPQLTDPTGEGPFGFAFGKSGALFTTEQSDGPAGPGRGAVSAYAVAANGTLAPTSASVVNGGTDTCWFVVADYERYGYAASFFADGRISSYRVSPTGALELLEADAARGVRTGVSDLSRSADSRYLHALNSLDGTITTYRVHEDGSLSYLNHVRAQQPSAMAAGLGLAAS